MKVQEPTLSEPFSATEIAATGLARAERLPCGQVCLMWYRVTPIAEQEGAFERRLVGRVVVPEAAIPEITETLVALIAEAAAENARVAVAPC